MSKIVVEPERPPDDSGGSLHTGLIRLQSNKHTPENVHFVNALQCYVICALPDLLLVVTRL